ncbi:MAG: RNA polymerase sigma factor [Pseudomonadota bacterium]
MEYEDNSNPVQTANAPGACSIAGEAPARAPAADEETLLIEALYAKHAHRITAGLRQMFGAGPPDPEEMTQLAFQKLIERKTLSDIRDAKSFLWRTARNLTLKEKRAASVRSKYEFEIENLFFATKWDETTPEGVLEAKQQLRVIGDVLRDMPVRRRRCFLLHKVEGYPIAKVGDLMGVPKSTAHREIVRAGTEIDIRLQRLSESRP